MYHGTNGELQTRDVFATKDFSAPQEAMDTFFAAAGEQNFAAVSIGWWDPIAQEALASTANACSIMPARLGNALGDYAALAVVIHALEAECLP